MINFVLLACLHTERKWQREKWMCRGLESSDIIQSILEGIDLAPPEIYMYIGVK